MIERPELRVARALTGGEPLSLRGLPDGGMCVVAADGRKLWFTPQQVGAAVEALVDARVRGSASKGKTGRTEGHD
jgi:hypothetical protein